MHIKSSASDIPENLIKLLEEMEYQFHLMKTQGELYYAT
jgi:hypothetical protein